ncbi:MAG: YkgJ family cysteine cluster protein [Candidatus Lokiarchaeota archaeon]|nr:YkgJ family cysteine cluster protein [Candidatus Lokiarchaeota archaeon]
MASLADFRFHCTKCGACCKYPGLIVNVTPRDVRVLAKHLKADETGMLKVLGFYQVEPGKDQSQEDIQEHMVFPPLKTHKGPAYLGLLKKPTGECHFLVNDKCSVYPARPRVCQSFPFSFKPAGEGPPISIARFATTSCPGVGQGEPVNPAKVKATGRLILAEIDEARAFARSWNNRPGDDPESFKPARLVGEMLGRKPGAPARPKK